MTRHGLGSCTSDMFVDHKQMPGQEMRITIDTALSASRCEAIVDSYVSVVNGQKMGDNQSNDVFAHCLIIDWCIPHPISLPNTMEQIVMAYTQGNHKHGLSIHRVPCFTDESD